MASTIVSSLTVFSDRTGSGNQSCLIFTANQQRWWYFSIESKTDTTVKCYYSDSATLSDSTTWSAGTTSPAFPSSRAMTANDARNMACLSVTNGSTDAVHVAVSIGVSGSAVGYSEHIRATFSGANTITWDVAWVETVTGAATTWTLNKGTALNIASDGFIHHSSLTLDRDQDANARRSSNADTSSSWTNAWGANAIIDASMSNECNANAIAPLGSGAMLAIYDNGGAASPNGTGLRSQKYTSGATWPTASSGDVGIGTSTQDTLDWCACTVDSTHVYCFRRNSNTAINSRLYDGSTWGNLTNAVPAYNIGSSIIKAASGMFAATDGTDLYLFVLDNTVANGLSYIKGSTASGTATWGSWTQVEAGFPTHNLGGLSGYPKVANSQIGILFTVVQGSNFDIAATTLSLGPPPPPPPGPTAAVFLITA